MNAGHGMGAPRLLIVADLAYAGGVPQLLHALETLGPLTRQPQVGIQLRAKTLSREALEDLAATVRTIVPPDARLSLNGDARLAARLGYAGAHWPEATLPSQVPALPAWHSAAAHSPRAVRSAEQAGCQAAIFGPVFAPGSKPGEGMGLRALRRAAGAADLPVLAIGGVTPDRIAACIRAGAWGVATVSGVIGVARPAIAASEYLAAFERATQSVREGVRE